MTKNIYIQPSVTITEMMMLQTLCASGGGASFSSMDPAATTDEQL